MVSAWLCFFLKAFCLVYSTYLRCCTIKRPRQSLYLTNESNTYTEEPPKPPYGNTWAGKMTNWAQPGHKQKQTKWQPRRKYLIFQRKYLNISTIVYRCHLAQHIPIPFHQDTTRQMLPNQVTWNLEIPLPNICYDKTPPQLCSRISDHANVFNTWGVYFQIWIKAFCFYICDSVSVVIFWGLPQSGHNIISFCHH